MSVFYVPTVNLIGKGVINEFGDHVKELGFKKALLVTDHFIASSEFCQK
ncbi:iron-containing alcohol dehydrogenase [Streptococcus merionis]|uniref:Iron-containing alcohol dehydrogenase n=1 Tax=Streptococcus merionis TaxID=400065 RepID=A0A239T0R6_9STRE|nr:iron-containing alcohol dehydrogenase [Streptococcus merionis]